MSTRVFRRPYARGSWQVSVQVSFKNKQLATQFAKRLDWLKAHAAVAGVTMSDVLLEAILEVDPKDLTTVPDEIADLGVQVRP